MEANVASSSQADNKTDADKKTNKDEVSPVHLVRQLGMVACITMTVGTVIGSGIFISPKGILMNTGSLGASMIVWALCGVLATLGALSYGELGTTFTKSGGDYIYLMESFGPMVAFIRIWTYLVSVRTGSSAVVALTAATYLHRVFLPNCEELPYISVRLIAVVILVFIFYVNCVSVPLTTHLQVILTVAKVLGIALIILTGFVFICKGQIQNFEDSFEKTIDIKWQQIPLAFYAGLFAFSGWQYTPTFAEEIVRPARTLPLSIIISMVIITTVYLTANVGYFVLLTPTQLLDSDAVALSFAQQAFGSFSWIVSLAVVLSCIGAINGGIFSTSRIMFVAAREGHLPHILSMIQIDKKTPLPAAAVILPITVIMVCGESVYDLITYLSFTRWLFVSLSVATIPYFRWKHPEWERPFKVPLFVPITFTSVTLLLVVMSLYSSPRQCGIGFLILISGIPVYLVGVRWKNKPDWVNNATVKMTIFFQKLFLVVKQETKTY
ncbi:cystine/glutamate transporter-like [Antedon mediterranea]|uniref:cystine/glutamate transporter-like n=1 Tax=Antedon mediterranea TaxID=105859 RepID=UPI003AF8A134